VAKRLGYGDAFAWQHPHEIFCEHAALTAFENDGARALNLHDLAALTREEWERLEPISGRGIFRAETLFPLTLCRTVRRSARCTR
jgi:assimilatory nitrate reductase catalytic subunit